MVGDGEYKGTIRILWKGKSMEHMDSLNKEDIPVCQIMGVNIAAINMDWLLNYTTHNIKALSGNYMCVSNVHTIVTAFENPKYCAIQNGGIMAIPDGGPLSSVGRKRGYLNMQRTTGPSYMEEIMKISKENGYRHFFYGATNETLDKLKVVLEKNYPGICIAGMYSPPFRPMSVEEDELITKRINESELDFLWIGLGAPKQENWKAEHKEKVKGFMVGVGAGFDYMAGNIVRAPEWMQRVNLEWFYRLKQEPQRLFRRYWHTNWKFIWHAYIKGE